MNNRDNAYPIIWWIEGQNIIMQDNNGKILKEKDNVYKSEINFIQDEISEMKFEGEILC